MIDRGALVRGFLVLMLLAAACAGAYALLTDTEGTSGRFIEDTGAHAFGPIYEEPDRYRGTALADPWLRDLRVQGGTVGRRLHAQVRIGIDGTGAIPTREVTLETPAAVTLFADPRRDRAEGVLRGIQVSLEERDGLIRGLAFTDSNGGAQAAAIANISRLHLGDGIEDPAARRLLESIIQDVTRELSDDAYAWYDPRFQDVVLGPEISRGLFTWIRTPAKATPAENIFTAHVLLHELEHAVTPDEAAPLWVEEGTADVLARWPGASARMARQLGMPYPKRYDRVEYRTGRGGYPEYVDSMRTLLGAAGIAWRDPKQLDEATALLQGRPASLVPAELAARIAKRHRLTGRERARLTRSIVAVDGKPEATRRLVASLRA